MSGSIKRFIEIHQLMVIFQSYNAAKAATISLTEQLAVELKNPGLEVRVNTLAPGYFPSEVSNGLIAFRLCV